MLKLMRSQASSVTDNERDDCSQVELSAVVGTGGEDVRGHRGTTEGELEVHTHEDSGATVSDSVLRVENISSGIDDTDRWQC